MKSLPARSAPRATCLLLALAMGAALAACSDGGSEPHGSPVLLKVYWAVASQQLTVWSRPTDYDPSLKSTVPPFASEVDFVFDRRLDGTRIEDIVTVDGVMMTRPKDPPPITASWTEMGVEKSVPLVVSYNPVPSYGGASSYAFARPPLPGFPSDAVVSFKIDPTRITSAYGDPSTVPDSIPVVTDPFDVTIGGTSGAIAPSAPVPLTASNRLGDPTAQSPFIHVTANGVAVPYKLAADANLTARWFLSAADCIGGAWPAGTTLAVTIDAGFPDAFGVPLAKAATATFTTTPGAGGSLDAACAVSDGGVAVSDAGGADASDAAADVGASNDASVDGGALDAAADSPGE